MLLRSFRSPAAPVETVSKTLTDGRSTFGYSQTKVRPAHREAPASRILLLNGLFEGRFIYKPLVRRMASLALARGDGLEVVTYDEPRVGSSAYKQAYRTERAEQMVRFMIRQSRDEAPVTLAGHSRGNISAVEIAPTGVAQQHIGRVVSVGGVGYTPLPKERLDQLDVPALLAFGAQEIKAPANRRAGLHAAPTIGRLLGEATMHVASNLDRAAEEVRTILGTDKIAETLDLVPVVGFEVVALDSDPFCPGMDTHSNLDKVAAARGLVSPTFTHFTTTHAGPLIDPTYTAPLYDILCNTQERTMAA